MTRSTITRVIEAFFRYKYLYLVPLVVAVLFGVYSATNQDQEYTSSGAVFVDRSSFVAEATGLSDGAGTYLTPAQFASQELNGLLQTDQFVEDVLTRAEVDPITGVPRGDQIVAARGAISAYPTSENLMIVRVTTTDPVVASEVALATVEQFQQFKVDLDLLESETSTEFFENSLDAAQQELATARRELTEWLAAENIDETLIDELGAARDFEYRQRVDSVDLARERVETIQQSLASAELLRRQAQTDVEQTTYLVDEPTVATQPVSGLTGQIVTIAAFSVLGLFVMLVGPVLGAVLDRSVLFREELVGLAGTAVIAVVPRTKGKESRIAGVAVPDPEPPVTDRGPAGDGRSVPPVIGRGTGPDGPPVGFNPLFEGIEREDKERNDG